MQFREDLLDVVVGLATQGALAEFRRALFLPAAKPSATLRCRSAIGLRAKCGKWRPPDPSHTYRRGGAYRITFGVAIAGSQDGEGCESH